MPCDPRMSEWGNPAAAMPPHRVKRGGRTRGTETSKYPEEEKITMIAQVVASERAGAQTGAVPVAAPGVVGPAARRRVRCSGSLWKLAPKRVTDPYAKHRARGKPAPEYRGARGILRESAGPIP